MTSCGHFLKSFTPGSAGYYYLKNIGKFQNTYLPWNVLESFWMTNAVYLCRQKNFLIPAFWNIEQTDVADFDDRHQKICHQFCCVNLFSVVRFSDYKSLILSKPCWTLQGRRVRDKEHNSYWCVCNQSNYSCYSGQLKFICRNVVFTTVSCSHDNTLKHYAGSIFLNKAIESVFLGTDIAA